MRLIILLSCYFFTFTLFANNGVKKCEIIIDSVEYRCFDNKSEADSTDDYFEVIIKISNIQPGIINRYKVNLDGIFVKDLPYDSIAEIRIPSDRNFHYISVHDYDDETCYKEFKTIKLNPCSIICDLQNKSEIEIHCNNNTSGADPSDDFYSITFGSPGLSYDNQYEVFLDGEFKGNFKYNLVNYINHPADLITHEISIRDKDNDSCNITTMLGYFKTCSFDCGLTVMNKSFECNNNNTKLDITDDFYELSISVDGYNTSDLYYVFHNDLNLGSFKYNVINKIKIKANGQVNQFRIQDINNSVCSASFASNTLFHCSIDCSLVSLPIANAGNDKILTCDFPGATLEASSNLPDNLVSYIWTSPQGAQINGKSLVDVDKAGTYILHAALAENGCAGKSDTVVVKENKKQPIANIIVSDSILNCKSPSIDVSYSKILNHIYEFSANGTVINDLNISIDRPSELKLKVTDPENGCSIEKKVSIKENKNKPIIKLIAPAYIKCSETTVTLDAGNSSDGAIYTWYKNGIVIKSGLNLNTLDADSQGTYNLQLTDVISQCTTIDSVKLYDASKIYYIILDSLGKMGCKDNSYTAKAKIESIAPIQVNNDDFEINWIYKNLSVGNSLSLVTKNEGTYFIKAIHKETQCEIKDSINVKINTSRPDLEYIKIKHENCFESKDGQISFAVKSDSDFEVFFNNQKAEKNPFSFENLPSGNYAIKIIDAKACSLDTVLKVNKANKIYIQTSSEIEIEYKTETTLKAKVNVPQNELQEYGWGPEEDVSCIACFETIVAADTNKTLMFSVKDIRGCEDTAYTRLRVVKTPLAYAPNILSFSNSENSHFSIFANEHILKINRLSVFDRWGNMIWNKDNFPKNDYAQGWNGMINGNFVLEGVYTYCSLLQVFDGTEKKFCGDITVIR